MLKFTEEQIENLNGTVFIKELEFVIESLYTEAYTQKTRSTDGFLGEFYQCLRKKIKIYTTFSRK